MARRGESGRRGKGAGWFTTLAGALLLVGAGFGIGIVSGALFEEPGLVFQHLAGRTQPLPLPGQEAAAPAPAPAAVAAGEAPSAPPAGASAPSVSAAPPSPKPPMPPPAARGRYVIQVGAFGNRQSAQALVRTLASSGLPGCVAEEASGPVRFKVRVGPFGTRQEADAVALRLKREKQLPTWVLSRDAD